MKITDSDIIKNGEQELIDAITADLDWGAIEEIFLKEHNLGIEEDIEYKSGDIVAVDNQIAYKLEFEVKVNLSVLLNRNGEYLSVNISGRNETPEENDADIYSESFAAETAPDTDSNVEESSHNYNSAESVLIEYEDSSVDTYTPDNGSDDETEDLEENIFEHADAAPFGDLSDNSTDDMGQKVDDILENIKMAG